MLIRKLISPDHLYHRRTKFTLSSYFQPFDTVPHNQTNPGGGPEESVSARLMTSYGVVRPAGPGTFHLLPLGLRAQNKLEALIDRELEVAGCQKISMPHLTPASLWRTSGRLEMMGSELMRLRDRQERPLVLAPTHEEAVTNILASLPVTSERDLPVKLYQIGTKFRDEMRPKFGLLRANEFRMQDLYTFDRDLRAAEETYQVVSEAYQRIFARLGVPWVRVRGDCGAMGGQVSHEYHFPASIGQDSLVLCQKCGSGANLELGETQVCPVQEPGCGGASLRSRGIEVAHTFLLGEKYSKPAKATFRTERGQSLPLQMGCFGIGVSRVLAASLEVLSSPTELRWPRAIAPFSLIILAPKKGSKEAQAGALVEEIHSRAAQIFPSDVMLDDREKLTVGRKLREAKKTGYPLIVLFGKKCVDSQPRLELHHLNTGNMLELSPGELLSRLAREGEDDDSGTP